MYDPKLGPDSKAAILRAMQRLALEQSAEESVNVNPESENTGRQTCQACGSPNRKGNNFCAACGVSLLKAPEDPGVARSTTKPAPEQPGEHHYHHHYHHHYFSPTDGMDLAAGPDLRASASDAAARDVVRARAPLGGASLSRAETALRKLSQDWALACNTKQLDDLVELYMPDAMVLRPNVPAVRGTAAIREFFFGLLDAGMSDVELDPHAVGVVRRFRLRSRALQIIGPGGHGQAARRARQISGAPQPSEQWRMEDSGRHLVQRPEPGRLCRTAGQTRACL